MLGVQEAAREAELTRRKLHPRSDLIALARSRLGLSQAELGRLLRSSERTVQRWETGESQPSVPAMMTAAEHLRAVDLELAKAVARGAGAYVSETAAGAKVPPPRPAPTMNHLASAVLYSAAEAASIPAQATRQAVLAAAKTMQELGLSTQDLLDALGSQAPNAAPKKPHS